MTAKKLAGKAGTLVLKGVATVLYEGAMGALWLIRAYHDAEGDIKRVLHLQ